MHDMESGVRSFILTVLTERMMQPIDAGSVNDDTPLGPEGMDLESLALVELSVHLENEYGVAFDDEDTERIATASLGDLCRLVVEKSSALQAG